MILLGILWKDIVQIPWSDQVSVNICIFIITTLLLNIASNNQHFLFFLAYNRKLIVTVVSGIELVELKSAPEVGWVQLLKAAHTAKIRDERSV